jgi:hypothetical protein
LETTKTEVTEMQTNEAVELAKYRLEMDQDAEKLVDRYLRIFEWETPEPNERLARQMIIDELRLSLDRLEKQI